MITTIILNDEVYYNLLIARFALVDEEKHELSNIAAASVMGLLSSPSESDDQLQYFDSNEQARAIGVEFSKNSHAPSEVSWKEMESDDAFSALFFYGNFLACIIFLN